MGTLIRSFAAFSLVMLVGVSSWAHKYVPNDGSHVDAAHALEIADPDLSQVVNHPVTPATAQVWLTLYGVAGQELYMQVGVPVLDRLEGYSPTLVLLGPGLPEIDTPLEVPAGLGGVEFPTEGLPATFFDEHFTGTQSWILFEQDYALPEEGTYYLAAYHPEGEEGKLWVAVGRREGFGFMDLLTFRPVVDAVREFHEVLDDCPPLLTAILLAISDVLRRVFWFLLP